MSKKIIKAVSLLLIIIHYSPAHAQVNIGERTFHFIDVSRNRPVTAEVWYPTTDSIKQADRVFSPFVRQYTVRDGKLPTSKLPLILISHGTGGNRLSLEWLAQALVKKGYIVAAVDHWGDTMDNMVPIEILKPWERPQDISFALTELLNDNDFKAVIDPQRIGAAGYSFGGNTVIELAGGQLDYLYMLTYYKTIGHKEIEFPEFPGIAKELDDPKLVYGSQHVPHLKDNRIKAFFAMLPGLGPGYRSEKQLNDLTGAIYIIGAAADSMAPIKTNATHYHQLIKNAGYFLFGGKTSHYVMLSEADQDVKDKYPLYFSDDPAVNRHEVHLKVDTLAATFFNKILK